jgi:hypothetical protein
VVQAHRCDEVSLSVRDHVLAVDADGQEEVRVNLLSTALDPQDGEHQAVARASSSCTVQSEAMTVKKTRITENYSGNKRSAEADLENWPMLYTADPELRDKWNDGNGRPNAQPAWIVRHGVLFLEDGITSKVCIPCRYCN